MTCTSDVVLAERLLKLVNQLLLLTVTHMITEKMGWGLNFSIIAKRSFIVNIAGI